MARLCFLAFLQLSCIVPKNRQVVHQTSLLVQKNARVSLLYSLFLHLVLSQASALNCASSFFLFNLHIKTRRKKMWSVLGVMTSRCFLNLTLAKSDWHVCTCSRSGLSGTSWKVHPHLLFWHFIYISKVLHFHVDGPHDGLDDWKREEQIDFQFEQK